jgi:hypothetical protein
MIIIKDIAGPQEVSFYLKFAGEVIIYIKHKMSGAMITLTNPVNVAPSDGDWWSILMTQELFPYGGQYDMKVFGQPAGDLIYSGMLEVLKPNSVTSYNKNNSIDNVLFQ